MFKKYITMYKKINTLCCSGLTSKLITCVRRNYSYRQHANPFLSYNFIERINSIVGLHKNDESFIIFHPNNVINRINQWSQFLPYIKPYYAIKCNPDINVLKIMKRYNMNYDCASKNEINKIIGMGIDSNKIIFANPSKMVDHIKFAKYNNISLMTFDSIEELYKIKINYPNADLILRIMVDDSQSKLKFNSKFGVEMKDVHKILSIAKLIELNVVGISFHVGSQCNDETIYLSALETCRIVYNMALNIGYKLNIINIGGGFPGYNDYMFIKMGMNIHIGIEKYFNKIDIDFIAEPGRFFAESAYTVVAKVINKKTIIKENIKSNIYYINEGVYGCFNNIITDKAEIYINTFKNHIPEVKCTIFGPSCDSLDCVAKDIMLPELDVGDYIYVENMGAYTTSCSNNFNGFPSAKVKYVMY